MKKVFALFLLSICVFISTGITASADCGPKASATVYVSGVENGRDYFIALLSDGRSFTEYPEDMSGLEDEVLKAIYRFSLSDEYSLYNGPVSAAYYPMTGRDSHVWGYMLPEKFKVVLYFPDDGSFILSEKQERYAFNSYYTANVENGAISVAQGGGAKGVSIELGGLLTRILITVFLEIGVGILFGYKARREIILILIVNIITQIGLNILIAIGGAALGGLGATIAYILAETAVFTIEAIVYGIRLPALTGSRINVDADGTVKEGVRYDKEPVRITTSGKAVGYAFTANLVSFVVGGLLLIAGDVLFQASMG